MARLPQSEASMPQMPNPDPMDEFADSSLQLWNLPDGCAARLLNVAENLTYLVEADSGFRSVLRIHRKGYHDKQSIRSELQWIKALSDSRTVNVPAVIPGRNGAGVQENAFHGDGDTRFMVMFAHLDGNHPDEERIRPGDFLTLGEAAARTHLHSMHWIRPSDFSRPAWDLDAILGANARWGNWRDAPNLTQAAGFVLERAEAVLKSRIQVYGQSPSRYGLIHADMRLANLIVGAAGIWIIDFDDCGPGWFVYDFAAAVSFIENTPRLEELKESWLQGYCGQRDLDPEDIAEIDSFVMLRRLALLAWVGSRIESTEPRQLAPFFAEESAEVAERFLLRHG